MARLNWIMLFSIFFLSTSSSTGQELDLGVDTIDLSKSNLDNIQPKPKAASDSLQKWKRTDIETTSILNLLSSEANKLGHPIRPSQLYTPWANYDMYLQRAFLNQKEVSNQPDEPGGGYRDDNWVANLLSAHADQKLSKEGETSMLKAIAWRNNLVRACGEEGVSNTEKHLRKPLKTRNDSGTAKTLVQKYSSGYTTRTPPNGKRFRSYVGDFDHGLYTRRKWNAE